MTEKNSKTGKKGRKPQSNKGLRAGGKVASASKQQKKTTMQLVARTKCMQTTGAIS